MSEENITFENLEGNMEAVTEATEPKPKKEKKKRNIDERYARKGPYRTTVFYIIGGLVACIPVAGLVFMLYLWRKAKDIELKSYTEAMIFLRPVVLVITLSIYTFFVLVLGKMKGYI